MRTCRRFALAGVAMLVALSGCAAYPFVGPTCGPGEVDIGDVGEDVTTGEFKGEVTLVDESLLVLDDGTGQAVIPLLDPGVSNEVETGDCVIARGAAVEAPDRPQDVRLAYTELLVEEFVFDEGDA